MTPAVGGPVVVAVVSGKGGVGKSSVTVSASAAFAKAGASVLVVDADPQGHAGENLGVVPDPRTQYTLAECLYDVIGSDDPQRPRTSDAIVRSAEGIDVLPTTGRLRDVSRLLSTGNGLRDVGLALVLDQVRDDYDYIFIDTPPNLDELPRAALCSGTRVFALGVTNGDPLATSGVTTMRRLVAQIAAAGVGPRKPRWLGTAVNRFEGRRNISQTVLTVLESSDVGVFPTKIPNHAEVPKAAAMERTVLSTDPRSKVAVAYLNLVNEMVDRIDELEKEN
jgi:chromosome partitioning protein